MERQTNTVTLPTGATAEIVAEWTFGEYQQIEAVQYKAAKSVRTDDEGRAVTEVNGDAIIEMERLAMRLGIKKLTASDGTDIPVSDEAIACLTLKDGMALRERVNGIGKNTEKK